MRKLRMAIREGRADLLENPFLAKKKRKGMPKGPASLEKLEAKKKKVYDSGAPIEGVRVCGLCNIVVDCQKTFESHCAGSRHVSMLQRMQESS
jgi:hypothetical protein